MKVCALQGTNNIFCFSWNSYFDGQRMWRQDIFSIIYTILFLPIITFIF